MSTELLVSKQAAINFVSDKINDEAQTVTVTKNANDTYTGDATFDDSDGAIVPTDAAKQAAKQAAATELAKPALAQLNLTLQDPNTYTVAAT